MTLDILVFLSFFIDNNYFEIYFLKKILLIILVYYCYYFYNFYYSLLNIFIFNENLFFNVFKKLWWIIKNYEESNDSRKLIYCSFCYTLFQTILKGKSR